MRRVPCTVVSRVTGRLSSYIWHPFPCSAKAITVNYSKPSSRFMSTDPKSPEGQASSPERRIHILGIGNVGKLFAHALATKETPAPVTLLLHRPELLDDWQTAGQKVEIITNGNSKKDGNYNVEVVTDSANGPITNLIVATKAAKTVPALQSIKQRLSNESIILFAQNGMGTIEEVSQSVFPDPEARPIYLNSVVSHGIYTTGPFSSVHAGSGYVVIGSSSMNSSAPKLTSPRIVEEIVSCQMLGAKHVKPTELLYIQLEKLTVNAMINPLTVIFNCQNGELFTREAVHHLMRGLLSEVSDVYQRLPELQGKPGVEDRFGTEKLEAYVLDMAKKTAANTSSMLQDARAGRETEINYINGYIIKRGAESGLNCPMNRRLVDMVERKTVITVESIGDWFQASETLSSSCTVSAL